jgi:hypothetical protein
VGQEKKITLWNNKKNDFSFQRFINDENDEGKCIAMFFIIIYLL